jgi:hypothetical protein
MLAFRALAAFLAWAAFGSVAAAQPGQVLNGALEPGDAVCTNLCDRYGLVWDGGGPVRVRLVTKGLGGTLRVTRTEGGRAPGAGTEVQLVARPGESVFVEVEESTPQGGGLYQLQIEPAPSRFRRPASPAAAPQGPPSFAPQGRPPSFAPPPGQQPAVFQRPVPPGAGAPADPTRETVERLMRGFRPASPLLVGRLEQVPALEFTAQRGRCYRSVLVLAQGARRRQMGPRSPAPSALVRMTLRTRRGPEAVTETERSTARVIALDDDLCPSENGTIEIAFLDRVLADTVSSPGLGPFTVQLFERPAGP